MGPGFKYLFSRGYAEASGMGFCVRTKREVAVRCLPRGYRDTGQLRRKSRRQL